MFIYIIYLLHISIGHIDHIRSCYKRDLSEKFIVDIATNCRKIINAVFVLLFIGPYSA